MGHPFAGVGLHFPDIPEQRFVLPDGGIAALNFGFTDAENDTVPLVGDWNADGVATIGLYKRSTATFYLNDTNTNGEATYSFGFGPPNGYPIAGDWNGDGVDTIGVFLPSVDGDLSSFLLRNTLDPGDPDVTFAVATTPTALPIAGDWDANGTVTVGWFDPPTATFHLLETNAELSAERVFSFGSSTNALPVAGKWKR